MGDERDSTQEPAAIALFDDEAAEQAIRRVWHEDRWFFSVIDVVGTLTDAPKPRQYWFDMKRRIQDEGFRELSAKCRQLKMRAPDGKERITDAADAETMLKITPPNESDRDKLRRIFDACLDPDK